MLRAYKAELAFSPQCYKMSDNTSTIKSFKKKPPSPTPSSKRTSTQSTPAPTTTTTTTAASSVSAPSKVESLNSTPGPIMTSSTHSRATSQSDSDAIQRKAYKDQEREEKISLALSRVNEGLSYRQAAKEIGISFGTVYGRFRGRKSRIRAQEVRMKLSFLEETIIEKVLLSTIFIGKPATQPFFVHTVNIILQAQGEIGVERVSRQWYRHFRRRHPSIDARDFSSLYKPLAKDPTNELAIAWFSYFERLCRNFRVSPENIYCLDELGFSFLGGNAGYNSPGSASGTWQPSSTSEGYTADVSNNSTSTSTNNSSSRDTGSVSSNSSNNSRDDSNSNGFANNNNNPLWKSETPPAISMGAPPPDFFLALETVCGDGTVLPPYISLHTDLAEKTNATFPESWTTRTAKSGWPNEQMLLHWIEHHFNPLTAEKANGNQRILILDTHVGHFSLPFLQYGMNNNITFLFVPPHSQGLMPFDVPPLVDFRQDIMANSPDFQTAVDRFVLAHNQVFNNANIKKSWRETGLIPFDPSTARPSPKRFHSSSNSQYNQSQLTPISDEYESSSSSQYVNNSYMPSKYAPLWPNDRSMLRYVKILDFNYDTFTAPTSERQISPSSNLPLFPEKEEEEEATATEQPLSLPDDEIVNAFSAFDLNTYAPNPSQIVTVDSSDSDNSLSNNLLGSELTKSVGKACSVLLKNKQLAEHSLEYHTFLSGFFERLKSSFKQLGEHATTNTSNKNATGSLDIEHLRLLESELKVVESYNQHLSSQISASAKVNDIIANMLKAHLDEQKSNSSTSDTHMAIPADKSKESSHKRNIESVETRSSDEELTVPHQRRKGSATENPMDVANINNEQEYDNLVHRFIESNPPFARDSLQKLSQRSPLPHVKVPNSTSVGVSSHKKQESLPTVDVEMKEESPYSSTSNTAVNAAGDYEDEKLTLPKLANNVLTSPHSALLPPLNFESGPVRGANNISMTTNGQGVSSSQPSSLQGQVSPSPTASNPTSFRRYSQSWYRDKYRDS